jgi:hypothetical protein
VTFICDGDDDDDDDAVYFGRGSVSESLMSAAGKAASRIVRLIRCVSMLQREGL